MRCPILVGRQQPAAYIADAVGGLRRHGRAATLVVAGEPGVGKTRLCEHTREVAARAGLRSVTGRALPGRLDSLLRPIAEVILDVTRGQTAPGDTELAPYVQVLAAIVPQWRTAGWSAVAEHPLVMAEAVLRVLRWATDGAGVIVILEDLHWADDKSLAVTRYLVDHAGDIPAVIVVTARAGGGREDVTAVLEAGGAAVLSLGRPRTTNHGRWRSPASGPARRPRVRPWPPWYVPPRVFRSWSRICWPLVTWADCRRASRPP